MAEKDSVTDQKSTNLGFAEANFSWEQYLRTRPKYPQSLFDLLYRHHGSSGTVQPTWGLAMDVGAGHGVVSEHLSHHFQRVAVCEPNEEYLRFAETRLQQTPGRFEFHQCGAEDKLLSTGTVDMVVMGMCIQWADAATAVNTAAYHLKPAGTLAIIFYRRPYLVGNVEAAKLWDDIWDAAADILIKRSDPITDRAWRLEDSGLDCVPVPSEHYSNVVRIKINAKTPLDFAASPKNHRPAPSAVLNTDVLEEVDNAKDWMIPDVNAAWLMKSLKSYLAGEELFDPPTETRYAQKFEQALAKSGGVANAVHPVSVILATKT